MTSTPSLAAPILAHVWQFRSFSPATLDLLAANATHEIAARGSVVIREGEAGIDAFVVIDGRLEVQIAGKTGPLPVAVLNAGDLFGEVAIVAGAERREPHGDRALHQVGDAAR
jgi:CRP-like cAMP-binding protein